MKAKNEKEFLALIKRYQTITIEEITTAIFDIDFGENIDDAKRALTGFGSCYSCSLCHVIKEGMRYEDHGCDKCVYAILGESSMGLYNQCINDETYDAINEAKDSEQLLAAYRQRAKYMKKVWKQYKIKYN